mmetsp:Transcript_86766/g.169774  ORF Transcript_86766/g.169774 Transcript_86766/m.169774 type:complete len:179 (+) Transcript_86766:73-609(+)|eukprot:CAMPEP_0170401984 /NCGR_PEP_ID=MMETSP0117_2-20130122/25313_1 /TAXON_ID=400756 /ORGANISM="Durinskia baltica, Strain CSIRO CS-38" /LENGTH=178 /DNA_ID=CAMNT_0010658817 /DNA_START=71 /DNA_END=607 /DNA_ORIENTATION=+
MNGGGPNYISPFNTDKAKYMGPLSVVTYEGPKNSENQMHGKGKVLFANGSTYEGELQNDMLNGYGVLTDTVAGSVYSGEFKDDMRHGQAVFSFNGCKYEGEYKENKRHGKGKETDADGNIFDGQFENGDFVRGKVFYSNDDIYVGEFKDDARHGQGKFIRFEDGEEFEGMWEDDVFKG